MEVKVICCVILIFTVSFDASMAQIAVDPVSGVPVAAASGVSPYNYGYSGAYGYYGYQGYGNPYYSYYSQAAAAQPAGVSSSGGGSNPAVSAAGGISSSIACANCGRGRN
uniref:Uncharacterized protein n=1 Tax=Panagrolaimus davidi TaxID=227884 RepID=A0A914Q6Q8_9BILA